MRHDGHLMLGETHGSEESLLMEVMAIQDRCMASRVVDWANNLRFIRTPGIGVQQQCVSCHTLDKKNVVLQLTEKHEQRLITNYVCVSYCWDSSTRLRDVTDTSYHI